MRVPALVLAALTLVACDGVVGELGQADGLPGSVEPGAPTFEEFLCSPSQGYAPLKVQCKAKASDKEGQRVRCQIAIADGLPQVDLADCVTEQNFELTLPTVGSYLVRAQAIDTDGLVSLRTQAFEVTEQPNKAPVVTDFVASPANGVVPLSTTVTWVASDPDGDALTCEVDFGDDGSVDRTFTESACTAGAIQRTVATAGSQVVLLRVKDTKGGVTEQRLTLTARMVTGEVILAGVEWMQSIVKENLKLVANKPAALRVYVTADRPGLANVRLDGEAFRAGVSLGKLTFTGPASPPTTSSPADLSQQYVAQVPAAMIATGLEIRLKADADDAVAESDENNNLRTLTPVVGNANVFELTAVPVVHQGQTATTPNIDATMQAVWPISKVNAVVRAPYTYSGTLTGGDGNAWGDLLAQMLQLRQTDNSKRQYYGWVRVSYGSGIAGIGYIGQPAATGRQDSLDTFAHEKGHNLGRPHAPCGGAASPDPNYPYAGATIGSWGYDSAAKRLINPASTSRDLMSYCDPAWVSDYNYNLVQTFMETQPSQIAGTAADVAPDRMTVLVSGAFRGGKWEFWPVHRLWSHPSAVEDGPLAVRLTTADGKVLTIPFKPMEVESVDDVTPGEQHFSMLVEDPGVLASMEVVSGTEVLASRAGRSTMPSAPQVERVEPGVLRVTWNSATHPSAAVAHLTADGRTTLAFDLRGGEALVHTDGLPETGFFEVSVSDGLNAVRRVVEVR